MELKRRVNLTRDQPTKEITQIPIYSKSRNSLKGSPIQSPEGTFQRERSSPRSPQNIPHSWVLSVMMNQLDSCKLLPASFTMAQTCLCTQELNLSRSWETTQSKQTYKTQILFLSAKVHISFVCSRIHSLINKYCLRACYLSGQALHQTCKVGISLWHLCGHLPSHGPANELKKVITFIPVHQRSKFQYLLLR